MYRMIANELRKMAQYDLEVRQELLKKDELSAGYNADMVKVQKRMPSDGKK